MPLHPARSLLLAAGLLAGCGTPPPGGASQHAGAGVENPGLPYSEVLAQTRLRRADLEQHGDPAGAAATELELAWLTGEFQHYQAAAQAAQEANLPCPLAARIHLAVHQLAAAAQSLATCAARDDLTPAARAELTALRADIEFGRGSLEQALAGYRDSLRLAETPAGYARLAQYYAVTGAPAEAVALLDRAERIDHGANSALRAWLALRRAELAQEQGRLDEALAQVLQAERRMPGWWLTTEHGAAIRALQGDHAVAVAQYRTLAEGSGNPEHLDAAARLYQQLGQPDAAAPLIQAARDQHLQRLTQLPMAAAAHAAEHFLAFDVHAPELLELAQGNLAQRPGVEARMLLAEVHLRRARPAAALAVLQPALQSGGNIPRLHALLAQALDGVGRKDEARARRALAIAQNPMAMEWYPVRPVPDAGALASTAPRSRS